MPKWRGVELFPTFLIIGVFISSLAEGYQSVLSGNAIVTTALRSGEDWPSVTRISLKDSLTATNWTDSLLWYHLPYRDLDECGYKFFSGQPGFYLIPDEPEQTDRIGTNSTREPANPTLRLSQDDLELGNDEWTIILPLTPTTLSAGHERQAALAEIRTIQTESLFACSDKSCYRIPKDVACSSSSGTLPRPHTNNYERHPKSPVQQLNLENDTISIERLEATCTGFEGSLVFDHRSSITYVPTLGTEGIFVLVGGQMMAIGRDKNTSSSNWENVTVFNPADGTFSVQPTRGNIPDEPLFANLLDTAAYCTFGEADRLHDRYDIFVYGAFRGTSNIYILTLPAFQWISVPSSQMPYQPEATCTGTGNGQMIIIWRIMSYQLIDHELGGPFGASQEIFEFFDEQFGNLGIFNLSSFETSRLYDAKAGPYISPEIVRAFYRTSPLTPSWLHPDVKNLLKPKRFPRSIRNPNFLSSFCIGILASSALLLCCRVFFDLIRRLILPNSGGPPEDTNLKNSSITTKGYGGVAVEDMISLTTGHSPTSLTAIFRSASGSLASILCETVISLYYRYGAERPIPPNHTRVRWTCACGEALFDDYLEYREGAARLLEARLNRTQSHPVTPETSSSASGRGSVASISSTVTTPIPIPSNYGFSSPREKVSYRTLFNYQGQHEALGIQLAPKRECWLLSCANEKGLTPGLSHLDVDPSKVFTDMDLAIAMREMYRKQVKKSWLGIFRLRGLSKIEFVQFFVHENRFADIRKVPDMPPIGRDYDYDFEPIELCPPIGSTFLLHLIKHPSDYENERITYSLLPKRKRKLSFGVGWGLHLAVGFLERRIWIAMLVILIIGGMVFGVTWSVKKADLQGAFTFAGFAVTLATFVLGALQSWIDERNSLLLQ